jgi:ubiquinone/menaquinone biosynthesis C-methylase UbiE
MSAGAAYKVKEIYCCDPSLRALKVLQKREIKNMYPILAKGEYLPFCDNFFDGVFSIFVIEHLTDPTPMLREIHRVLKPSGKLVIATDTKWFYKYFRILFEWREKGWKKWKPDDPTHVNLMVPEKLRKILIKNRFKILDEYIKYLTLEKIRVLVQWFPKRIWDSFLSTSFTFICSPDK